MGTLSERDPGRGSGGLSKRQKRVLIKGSEVNLTPKEFDICTFLSRTKVKFLPAELIYRAV